GDNRLANNAAPGQSQADVRFAAISVTTGPRGSDVHHDGSKPKPKGGPASDLGTALARQGPTAAPTAAAALSALGGAVPLTGADLARFLASPNAVAGLPLPGLKKPKTTALGGNWFGATASPLPPPA